jgi:hypothetical protein
MEMRLLSNESGICLAFLAGEKGDFSCQRYPPAPLD